MEIDDLINFEKEIYDLYNDGKIKGVIHLSGGNEQQILQVFDNVKKEDWVFSNHRNHYHILLKAGKKFCKDNILKGDSMHQYSKKHKVFTSGIVCGQVPIALGVALALKLKKKKGRVWCFVGDMASEMGSFNVCLKYAIGHELPITFVIENNHLGVYTPTKVAWGITSDFIQYLDNGNVDGYTYERRFPHHGIGKFIHF